MNDVPVHKVKLETLGCKLNFSETATMQSLLAEHGIEPVGKGEVPDVCVVNTCSVTALADSKCRQHIRHLIRQYPDALIVVTGCYAQLKGKEIAEMIFERHELITEILVKLGVDEAIASEDA